MTRLAASPARQIGIGLGIAAVAQLLSLFLAGAGHGWVAPLAASVLLWLMTPLALMHARPGSGARPGILLPMLSLALLADAWLVWSMTRDFERLVDYVEINGLVGLLIIGLWIAAWLFWQGLVISSLLHRKVEQ